MNLKLKHSHIHLNAQMAIYTIISGGEIEMLLTKPKNHPHT
jgi:hypothetical protein